MYFGIITTTSNGSILLKFTSSRSRPRTPSEELRSRDNRFPIHIGGFSLAPVTISIGHVNMLSDPLLYKPATFVPFARAMYFHQTFLSIVALALVSRALSIPSRATSGTSDIVIDTVEYLNHQRTIESTSANELDTLSSYRQTIESTGADELDTLSSYRRTPSNKVVFEETDILIVSFLQRKWSLRVKSKFFVCVLYISYKFML
ncbi:hypothetical protein SERLA73DRAFT_185008 [Serpula lacrymans var. lacrymans S7.3]|uniref:Uncharacterized protein n=2 Tax=Serpula lacrymans var. lacrymans TaxID=341189 RepID=F8Q3X0_SERL3|nr:uncharacterized protein SERLADRAFT_473229 [Serpula lacrymans var. lacrymans S7.9]EGN96826.1 hypothetical protein SERLA73DRAFT_185008 [Serpula lacrymans var. lacrymans S7.3]EGO22429.1 hypothetical protein SERLADRAFT_473229 [Serpula lacrymans var. lacrymans S7.9]